MELQFALKSTVERCYRRIFYARDIALSRSRPDVINGREICNSYPRLADYTRERATPRRDHLPRRYRGISLKTIKVRSVRSDKLFFILLIWYHSLIDQTHVRAHIMARCSLIARLAITAGSYLARLALFLPLYTGFRLVCVPRRKPPSTSPIRYLSRIMSSACFYFNYLMVSLCIEVRTIYTDVTRSRVGAIVRVFCDV